MNSCNKCHFDLINNNQPLTVLKMLKIKKSNNDNCKYPILVADFKCSKCDNIIHVKWQDVNKDLAVEFCNKCESPMTVSIFLGLMNGFNLKSICFSCYNEIGKGNVGFQK